MKLITENLLKEKGACDEAVEWLRENFPEGMPVTVENIRRVPYRRWVDWTVKNYFSATARKAYDEETAPALKAYDEVVAPASKAYDKAVAPALKAYDKAVAPALKAYEEETAMVFVAAWNERYKETRKAEEVI